MDEFYQHKGEAICAACDDPIPAGVVHQASRIFSFRMSVCPECWMHMGDRVMMSPLQKMQYLMQLLELTKADLENHAPDPAELKKFLDSEISVLSNDNAEALAELLTVGSHLFLIAR